MYLKGDDVSRNKFDDPVWIYTPNDDFMITTYRQIWEWKKHYDSSKQKENIRKDGGV